MALIKHPSLRGYVEEALKTWRKRNAAMLLATQSVEDFASADPLRTVIEGCPTKLLLANPALDRSHYADLFQLNATELDLLTELVPRRQRMSTRFAGGTPEGLPILRSCRPDQRREKKTRPHGGKAFLVDASGRDLASGVDRAEFIRAAQEARLLWFSKDGASFNHLKSGDGHWFFLQTVNADRGGLSASQRILVAKYRFFEGTFAPERLWLMAGVLAICYIFARSLTAPLRSLQSVVEHFGRGDFTARSNSEWRDEVGELARTFDGMAKQIQSLLDRQRELLRDISHELRSPLTRLSLALQLARSGSDRFQALDRIEREASRLSTLVGELLSLARMESGESALHLAAVRLDQMLGDVVESSSLEASSRDCRLRLSSDAPVTIEADEELLRRAVENVISNAVHYSPAGSEISVIIDQDVEVVRIRVRDFGPGVPAESLGRIFDPFWRVDQDRSRDTGGVGLGLAITRHAVEAHGGQILVRNVDPGLEVEIRLPHDPASANRALSAAS